MLILSDPHIYIWVISADSFILSRQRISVALKDAHSKRLFLGLSPPVSRLPFNPGIRMDGGHPLTTYLRISCVQMCVCDSVCVCVCGYCMSSLFCVRVYSSLCVCVFLVRSSAGGDHGGAGEERGQHTGPHHLRRDGQGREAAGIEPTARRTGGQVGTTPEKKKKYFNYGIL